MATKIELSEEQFTQAKRYGRLRQENALRSGAKHFYPGTKNTDAIGLMGVVAEMAVARLLNIEWEPQIFTKDQFLFKSMRHHDIGGYIEVKSTTHPRGHLLIPETHLQAHIYILVTLEDIQRPIVIGYATKDIVMNPEYLKREEYGNSYWVPQEALKELHYLPSPGLRMLVL